MKTWVPTFESWFEGTEQINELVKWAVEFSGAWLPVSVSQFAESDDRYALVFKNLSSLFENFYGFEVPDIVEQSVDIIADRITIELERKFDLVSQLAGPAEYDDFVPSERFDEMIKRSGKGWAVYTKDGKKKLGSHPTRKKALAQLRAIEISKHSK